MTRTKMVPPIDPDLLSRVENLDQTATFLRTLVEIVQRDLNRLREIGRAGTYPTSKIFAQLGDWEEVDTLLRLLDVQIEIVADVANAVIKAELPVQL